MAKVVMAKVAITKGVMVLAEIAHLVITLAIAMVKTAQPMVTQPRARRGGKSTARGKKARIIKVAKIPNARLKTKPLNTKRPEG